MTKTQKYIIWLVFLVVTLLILIFTFFRISRGDVGIDSTSEDIQEASANSQKLNLDIFAGKTDFKIANGDFTVSISNGKTIVKYGDLEQVLTKELVAKDCYISENTVYVKYLNGSVYAFNYDSAKGTFIPTKVS